MNRRTLLTGLAALSATSVAVAAPANPDAELIRLCDQFVEIDRDLRAKLDATEDDREGDAIHKAHRKRMEPLLDRFTEMPATTLSGVQAKARALKQFAGEIIETNGHGWDGAMAQSLLNDLTERHAA